MPALASGSRLNYRDAGCYFGEMKGMKSFTTSETLFLTFVCTRTVDSRRLIRACTQSSVRRQFEKEGSGTRTTGPRTLSPEALTGPGQESACNRDSCDQRQIPGERSRSDCLEAGLDSPARNSFVIRPPSPDPHGPQIPPAAR